MALPPSTDSAFHSAVTLLSKEYLHLIGSRTSVLFSIIPFLLLLLLLLALFLPLILILTKLNQLQKPEIATCLFPLSEIASCEQDARLTQLAKTWCTLKWNIYSPLFHETFTSHIFLSSVSTYQIWQSNIHSPKTSLAIYWCVDEIHCFRWSTERKMVNFTCSDKNNLMLQL